MESKHCLNCNANLIKAQKFCANCGQPTSTHRFTLGSFFHEAFHAITHADKGIFSLLKELTIRPGLVAREYIGGKRKKYFNPFTFFLLLMALFVLVGTFVRSDKKEAQNEVRSSIAKIEDVKERDAKIQQYERAMIARGFMTTHGNLVAMFAIPFFALFFWLIYHGRQYNYSEHLVANLMFVTIANLAFTLVVFPLQGALKGTPVAAFMTYLGFILQAFYFTLAYKGFLQLKGFWPTLKLACLSVIGIMLWALFTISSMAIYVTHSLNFYDYFRYFGR